jgi:hypothetical protein
MRLPDWECGSRKVAGNVLIRSDLVLDTLIARPHDAESRLQIRTSHTEAGRPTGNTRALRKINAN